MKLSSGFTLISLLMLKCKHPGASVRSKHFLILLDIHEDHISCVTVCLNKADFRSSIKKEAHFVTCSFTHSTTAAWPLLWTLSRKQPVRSPQNTVQTPQRKPLDCG